MKNLFESLLTPEEFNASAETLYGLPKEKKFPLNDKAHVIKAIQFFEICPKEKYRELANNIIARTQELGIHVEIDEGSVAYEYLAGSGLRNTLLELPYELKEKPILLFPNPPKDTMKWWREARERWIHEMENVSSIGDGVAILLDFMTATHVALLYREYEGDKRNPVTQSDFLYCFILDVVDQTLRGTLPTQLSSNLLDRFYQQLTHRDIFFQLLVSLLTKHFLENPGAQFLHGFFDARGKIPEDEVVFYKMLPESIGHFLNSLDDFEYNHGPLQLPLFQKLLEKERRSPSLVHPYIIPSSTVKYTSEGSVEYGDIIIDNKKKQFLNELMEDSETLTILEGSGVITTIDDIQVARLIESKQPITVVKVQDIQPNIDRPDSRYFCFLNTTEESIQMVCEDNRHNLYRVAVESVDGNIFRFGDYESLEESMDSEEFDPSVTTEGISVNPDGSLRFTIKPQKSYMDEYAEAHRVLMENHRSKNYEAMKGNLCFLFTLIATIERDVLYTKKSVPNDVKKDALDARAAAINDFKTYLKVVQENDKEFDFMKYYQDSNYGKLVVTVTPASIRGMKKLLTAILY